MSTALIVGASRGLGHSLVKDLASRSAYSNIFATVRSSVPEFPKGVHVIKDIDVSKPDAGSKIVKGLGGKKVDLCILAAGWFKKESLKEPDWDAEVEMYKICAIGPTFIAIALANANAFANPAKLVFVSTEGGSISLLTKSNGGGMYGHHASKTALNMSAKSLSYDLAPMGVTVAMIHPGFMRTELTKSVGFDEFYDSGGAITPDEAAKSLVDWSEKELKKGMEGSFWAPRGPEGIGTVEEVMGSKDKLSTPLELPW